MVTGDDPKKLFSGTEKFGLTVQGLSPACPVCGAELTSRFGWKAELDIEPVLISDALYCEKCDMYFVKTDPPIATERVWKKTRGE